MSGTVVESATDRTVTSIQVGEVEKSVLFPTQSIAYGPDGGGLLHNRVRVNKLALVLHVQLLH